MFTVEAPVAIVADDPFSALMSPTWAEGLPPIRTVPDAVTVGPPTCGTSLGGTPLNKGQVV